jgi:hypothetical protein
MEVDNTSVKEKDITIAKVEWFLSFASGTISYLVTGPMLSSIYCEKFWCDPSKKCPQLSAWTAELIQKG